MFNNTKKKFKSIIKIIWIGIIIIFLLVFLIRNYKTLIESLVLLDYDSFFISLILIIASRLLLSVNMLIATRTAGFNLTFSNSYSIYFRSQIAKYIPGSIWQYFGRYFLLNDMGASKLEIRDSIIIEHFWIVCSSILFGSFFLLISKPSFILQYLDFNNNCWYLLLPASIFIVSIIFLIITWKKSDFLIKKLLPPIFIIFNLLFIWLTMGFSLWFILFKFQVDSISIFFTIGAYSIAWVLGFLVPFVPAGLGVRDGFLVFAFYQYIPLNSIILLIAIHRIIYFLAEVLLVLPCLFSNRKKTLIE